MTNGGNVEPAHDPRRVTVDDLEIACLTSQSIDDTGRPLAICIHGFPDTAHTWRHVMADLDAAGYRVVAPFLRGYAPSAVPADGCVQIGASVVDVGGLHEHFGGDQRAVVIGHDWGAPIAYAAAVYAPDRWSRVIGLAVPPGSAIGDALLTDTDQLKRSWYMFFFLHPLADLVVPAHDLAFIEMLWSDWAPGYDASSDLPHVKDALRDPANLAAALGYYRSYLGEGPTRDELKGAQAAAGEVPEQPLLYLHGTDDGCIGIEVAESARAIVGPNVTIESVPDTGHFLHLEAPVRVNARILEFLA